jgi:ADP-heptose:LPS heptosyltransferase
MQSLPHYGGDSNPLEMRIFAIQLPGMRRKKAIKSVLIIQTAFIGDVILATGLIEKIAMHYPEACIDFLCRKGNEGVLANNPHLNKVLIWNKQDEKAKSWWNILREVRSVKYDLLINLQRFASMGLFTVLSGAKTKVGFRKNPFSAFFSIRAPHTVHNGTHEIERNQKLIRVFTNEIPSHPKIYPSEADAKSILPYQEGPYLCIAPASVWFTKQFPEEKWLEFLRFCKFEGRIYVLGAPADTQMAESIIRQSEDARLQNLCGKLSLLQSALLMKGAKMNYVNDSAPMHLCSAIDAPVAAIYCSTVPEFGFGPLSSKSKIIQSEQSLKCRPCGLHGHRKCPKDHFDCALSIRPEQLCEVL